jgi:hypothetical protein
MRVLSALILFAASNPPTGLAAHRLHAATVLKRYQSGSVRFVNEARDLPQLKAISATGMYQGVVFSLPLLQTLDRLSARSAPPSPLLIMSLYRANSRAHKAGIAADIAGFGGFIIDSRKADNGLKGILAIIKALGPGDYSFGLPKPPDSDPIPLMPPPKRLSFWPFFPAPEPKLVFSEGKVVVAPMVAKGKVLPERSGKLQPQILRWANERSAPLQDLGSPELRNLLTAASDRGIRIRTLFPDALDHLHLEAR